MSNPVDDLKSKGEMFEAGKLAFETGRDRSYGCHFGMRSTRERDMRAFFLGYDQAVFDANVAKLKREA